MLRSLLLVLCLFSPALALDFDSQIAGSMPAPRSNPAVVEVGGRLFVLGGNDADGPTRTVWEYDPLRCSWTLRRPMPTARWAHSAVVHGGQILVFGGFGDHGPVAEVEALDPATGSWRKAGRGPARARMAAVSYQGHLLLIGGEGPEATASPRVDVYDPNLGSWKAGPELPVGRNRHAAVVFQKQLYVLGGQDPEGKALASTLRLEGQKWAAGPPMQEARKNFAASVLGPRLVAAGGWDTVEGERRFRTSIEGLDSRTGRWAPLGSLEVGRDGVRSVTLSGRVYLFGGYDGGLLDSFETCAWRVPEPGWRLDRGLKFHLACYSEAPQAGEPVRSLGYTRAYEADITNISLAAIRKLGFPLPARSDEEQLNFYLKFFQYPAGLDPRLSARRILQPLLVDRVGSGEVLAEEVIVKAGLIAPSDLQFTPRNPYPPFRPGGQEWLDENIPFSSLYVQTTDGILAFQRELVELLGESYDVFEGFQSDRYHVFLDDSGEGPFRVIRVLREPMIFANFRDLPLPQEPGMFLTGLLLIHDDLYPRRARIAGHELNRPIRSHVLEVGSVARE